MKNKTFITLNICIITVLTIILMVSVFWRAYNVSIIPVCKIYPQEAFRKHLAIVKAEFEQTAIENPILFDLHFEFPFFVSKDSILFLSVLDRYSYNLYFDHVPPSRTIRVNVPSPNLAPSEYPDGYYWRFHLYMPEKSAICSWNTEELMRFKNANFSHSWRIKLLAQHFEKYGGLHSTIIEPM